MKLEYRIRKFSSVNPKDIAYMTMVMNGNDLNAKTNLRNELARNHGFKDYREMKDSNCSIQIFPNGLTRLKHRVKSKDTNEPVEGSKDSPSGSTG